MRRMKAMNDAMGLLQLCKVAKKKNSKFQYAYTTDEENRLAAYTIVTDRRTST